MLTAAVLVPDTALLVPGAAGAAEVLADERSAAEAAAVALLAAERIIVVVPARAGHRAGGGGLADAGVDRSFVAWPMPDDRAGGGVAAAVASALLTQVGWTGSVELIEVGGATGDLHALGERLVRTDHQVGLLVLGTVGARREAASPLPADPRAASVEDAVLADLAELDRAAIDRLAAVPADLADQLASTVWAGSHVLVGAVRAAGPPSTSVVHRVTPGPVRYAVLSWHW